MLSVARQLPAREGVAQGGFKASAFSKASASWEVGSNAGVCLRVTLYGRALPLASSHGYGLREVVFKEIFSRVLDFLTENPLPRFAR